MTDSAAATCSVLSHDAGEQLFGTATTVAAWFLIEYEGRWEPEAFDHAEIPAPVKQAVSRQAMAMPRSRIQVIRQKPRLAPDGIAFFVILGRETHPALYEFHLKTYEDLLALDLAAICAEDAAYELYRRTEPLYLVCAHGRRDRCCAQHGVPVYEQISPQVGAAVWQTSHVGGHRFAANMICFPHGIVYGRVNPDNAPALVDAYRAGQIVPDHYRGRACYSKAAQAAEYYLRTREGSSKALEAYTLGEARAEGPIWQVSFTATADAGQRTLLTLEEQPAALSVYSSCGDAAPGPVSQFRLVPG